MNARGIEFRARSQQRQVRESEFVTLTPDRLRRAADLLEQDLVFRGIQSALEGQVSSRRWNALLVDRTRRVLEVLTAPNPREIITREGI